MGGSPLSDAKELVGLSSHDARCRLGPAVEEYDSEYEKLVSVCELSNPETFPGRVFLRGGKVELVYLPGSSVADLSRADIEPPCSGPPHLLASRAAKSAVMYVWPQDGIAYSAHGDTVNFVEVFVPRSLAEYEADVYREPSPWIR